MAITCCISCSDRFLGCHGACQRYAAEKADNEARKDYIRQFKEIDRFTYDVWANGAGKRWKAVRA